VAVIEAQMTGIPVIATRHAGIPDVVVENETGLLVDETDVTGMANAMIELARNPQLAGKMGRAARERMLEKFTLDRHIEGLARMIEAGVGPGVIRTTRESRL
jgi:glycosyltransferase involved in cell wall biosynthesis